MSTSHPTREPGTSAGPSQRAWEETPEAPRLGPDEARSAWPAFLAAGLAAIVVGILLFAWPNETLALVAILIGVSLLVAGIKLLIEGFAGHRHGGAGRAADVVIGLLALLLGLYCLRHLDVTVVLLAVIVGIFWVIHGIADLATGMSAGPFPGRGLVIATGVLSLLAGLILIFWPAISLSVLVLVIGIWLLVYGAALSVMAFQLRQHGGTSGGPGPMAVP